jgi:4-hydroxy-tetrahydrodipicolinate synthase
MNANRHLFSGTGVALVTPFKKRKIDWEGLERVIEHVIAGGVEYIVSLGTTGEAITLSTPECRQVFDFTKKIVNRRIPIVAGLFGGNSTEVVKERLKNYNIEGFDAVLSSSPSYNKPTQEGIFQHYMAMAKVTPLPIIIYNVPSRTASNVSAETTLRLAEASDKFVAVKEASGDMSQCMKICKYAPPHFAVLSGDDPITMPLIACGAQGVISVIANAFPAQFSEMTRAALRSDYETALRLHNLTLDVHKWLYVEGNPVGIKGAMEILGLCSKEVRLPLVGASDSLMKTLKKEVEKVVSPIMA